MWLVFIIWETHSYFTARVRVGYMTYKKPLKSQFCCSMTALHLAAFTAGGLPATWKMVLCFLCGFCKAHGKHPIWDKRKRATRFLQCLLKQGLCSPARCWASSVPREAVSTWDYRDTGGIKSDPLRERDQPITASVHIIFSFDCCRPKYLFFFTPLNFLLVSNFNWKSAGQEKLRFSPAFGIGTINWHGLGILQRIPEEILFWHTAKGCMDC